ncbi:MAG: hypothetical protein ACP5F2_02660 [Athalassotoga sp.]|uniref:hypothetical protein n=1 Tax=Athalassotoga sp. TaxID=2022597 RepID=UPI003D0471C4
MKKLVLLILNVMCLSVAFSMTNIVAYNQIALISSNVTVKNGKGVFIIPATNGTMPESLVISANGTYEYHSAESYTLDYFLKKFLGTTVQFEFTSESTNIVRNVRILSANPVIIQNVENGKIYFSPSGQFIFPSFPQIDSQNYFIVSTNASSISYSYLTNGIGWKAYYTLNLDNAIMTGKVELWNKTDTTFRNFNLSILSGNLITSNTFQPQMVRAFNAAFAPATSMPEAQSVEGYKIYGYGKVEELDSNSAVFLPLFSKNVKVEKLNIVYNPSQNFTNAVQVAKVSHDFPVPAGTVSLYRTNDDITYFLGQTNITNTASGISLDLSYGQNFDLGARSIEIQRTMVSKDLYDHYYQVTAINSSSTPGSLWIYISIPSDATVISVPSGIKFERPSTTQIRFYLDLGPNSKEVFTYGLQTSY